MKRIIIIILTMAVSGSLCAQGVVPELKTTPVKKWYMMNSGELIFSAGELKISNAKVDISNSISPLSNPNNVVRFSVFFHTAQEVHYNFSNAFGFYIGVAIRNVGFINHFKIEDKEMKLKQRSYALGIPVALKVGNMQGYYLNLGVEPEMMFAYKRKVIYDGEKSKKSEWFSDDVNLFNPSVFAQINFKGGFYLRAKYYLNDFLADDMEAYTLPGKNISVDYKVDKSTLFYISIGNTIKSRKAKKVGVKPVST
ncbi:MAG: hypothetical protein JSS90_07340 [Bacteroidetes bacterium]|nr:hypothetical protein [Bacteroidota bacterium]